MRITYVTESFPPDLNGVARTAVGVGEQLVAAGHQLRVVAPAPPSGVALPDRDFSFPVTRVPSVGVPIYQGFRAGLPVGSVRDAISAENTDMFNPKQREEDLHRTLAAGSDTVALYVGRLAGEKRLDLLADVAGLPGVQLVVVGPPGPGEAAARLALPSATFLGPREGEELARIFASSDVFVHAGPHETYGLTLQEAAASGLPVVAPASGGPLNLVDHGVTGYLVTPGNARALAAKVEKLAADPALRAAQGAAGRRRVAERSWQALSAELIGHYEAVRESRGASRRPAQAAGHEKVSQRRILLHRGRKERAEPASPGRSKSHRRHPSGLTSSSRER